MPCLGPRHRRTLGRDLSGQQAPSRATRASSSEAALEGIVLFIVLRLLTHRFGMLQKPGVVMGGFIAGYGVSRTIVEFFREPDAQIGFLIAAAG